MKKYKFIYIIVNNFFAKLINIGFDAVRIGAKNGDNF